MKIIKFDGFNCSPKKEYKRLQRFSMSIIRFVTAKKELHPQWSQTNIFKNSRVTLHVIYLRVRCTENVLNLLYLKLFQGSVIEFEM